MKTYLLPITRTASILVALFTLTLHCLGAPEDYEFILVNNGIKITGYHGPGGVVILPATLQGLDLEHIGDSAFADRTDLTQVIMPKTVLSIGDRAFSSCSYLTNVTIPNRVKQIGDQAFSGCSSLSNIILPDELTHIGESAFEGCSMLFNVNLPSSTTHIGSKAFFNCAHLSHALFLGNAPTLGDLAFGSTAPNFVVYYRPERSGFTLPTWQGHPTRQSSSGFTTTSSGNSVTITGYSGTGGAAIIPSVIGGKPVTKIQESAFEGNSTLVSVLIPDGVTHIGPKAFRGCENLTNVTIAPSVIEIGSSAFEYSKKLISIHVPWTVATIGNSAFFECRGLRVITVDAKNAQYSESRGALLNKTQTTLIRCPGGKTGVYDIPASVTNIEAQSFFFCAGLTRVTIPVGVSLIPMDTFSSCKALTSISLPNGLTTIQGSAFRGCISLTEVDLPLSVTTIDRLSFASCAALTHVTIPANITFIGEEAFGSCGSLASITVDVANVKFRDLNGVLFNKNRTTLIQYPAGRTGTYEVPTSVTTIQDYAFKAAAGLTDVTLPAGITSINFSTFASCSGLTHVTLPNSITSIEPLAFQACTALRSIKLPASVSNIEYAAFMNCKSLTHAVFFGNAPILADGVFEGTALDFTAYYISGQSAGFTSPTWETYPCYPTSSSFTVTSNGSTLSITGYTGTGGMAVIPSTVSGLPVTRIAESAFNNITNLAGIMIPASVASIGDTAFSGCSNLTSVYLPANLTTIGEGAFGYCSRLAAITVSATNSQFSDRDGVLFNKRRTTLIQYPGGKVGPYEIPAPATRIGPYAFSGCEGLTDLIIPARATTIGYHAFDSCTSLTSITIPAEVTNMGQEAFAACANLSGATFLGDAPMMETDVFSGTATGFTIYYHSGKAGFTSPIWHGYPAVALASPGYQSWTNLYFPGVSDPAIIGPEADPDHDGLSNAVEMVLGSNPASEMNASLAPKIQLATNPGESVPPGHYLVFTYRRTDTALAAGMTSSVEYSSSLSGGWALAAHATNGVWIIEDKNLHGTGVDGVRVYLPKGTNPKMFARLRVDLGAAR